MKTAWKSLKSDPERKVTEYSLPSSTLQSHSSAALLPQLEHINVVGTVYTIPFPSQYKTTFAHLLGSFSPKTVKFDEIFHPLFLTEVAVQHFLKNTTHIALRELGDSICLIVNINSSNNGSMDTFNSDWVVEGSPAIGDMVCVPGVKSITIDNFDLAFYGVPLPSLYEAIRYWMKCQLLVIIEKYSGLEELFLLFAEDEDSNEGKAVRDLAQEEIPGLKEIVKYTL